jgi:DHA1 family multidrug resistance protein-like MFS transporter
VNRWTACLNLADLRVAIATPWVRAIVVLTAAQVASELAFSFALPFTPIYVQQLGVPDLAEAGLWAGLMAGVYAVALGVMAPVWGVAADRFGHRRMVQRALLGGGLVLGAIAFVQSPMQLLVLRIFHGAFSGVMSPVATLASLIAPSKHLPTVLGILQAAVFLGVSVGPLLGGEFADHFGLRAGFGVTGILLFGIGILVMLVVREPPRGSPAPEATADSAPHADAGPQRRLITRELLAVVSLIAIVRFVNLAPMPVLPLFMEELVADPDTLDTTVGLVLSAAGIASTIAALSIGRLTDRYGWRLALLACVALAVAISPVHLLVASVWQLVVVRSVFGLAIGGLAPAVQALLVKVTPARSRGTAFGLSTTANVFGNGGGPIVGSVSAAAFGESSVFLVVVPFLAGAGWLLAHLRLRSDPADAPSPAESH